MTMTTAAAINANAENGDEMAAAAAVEGYRRRFNGSRRPLCPRYVF
jgi:hypothetical protein